jgi:hypothetical protein
MSAEDPQGGKLSRGSLVLSIVALIVSAFSVYSSYSSSRDTAKSQVIQQSYEGFYQLTRLQLENWQLSHMFALPDQYDGVTKLVEASFRSLDSNQQAELVLKERAIADIIFNMYEQAFYQLNQANEARDTTRASFLQEVINYLTGKLLRNPRLLYYWSESGGRLASSYEDATRKHYESNVLHNARLPLQQSPDAAGPLVVKKRESR